MRQPLLKVIFGSLHSGFHYRLLILTISTIFYTIVKIVNIIICSEKSLVKLKLIIFFDIQ